MDWVSSRRTAYLVSTPGMGEKGNNILENALGSADDTASVGSDCFSILF